MRSSTAAAARFRRPSSTARDDRLRSTAPRAHGARTPGRPRMAGRFASRAPTAFGTSTPTPRCTTPRAGSPCSGSTAGRDTGSTIERGRCSPPWERRTSSVRSGTSVPGAARWRGGWLTPGSRSWRSNPCPRVPPRSPPWTAATCTAARSTPSRSRTTPCPPWASSTCWNISTIRRRSSKRRVECSLPTASSSPPFPRSDGSGATPTRTPATACGTPAGNSMS